MEGTKAAIDSFSLQVKGDTDSIFSLHTKEDTDSEKSLALSTGIVDDPVNEGNSDGEIPEHTNNRGLEEFDDETEKEMETNDYFKDNFVEVKVELVEEEFEENPLLPTTFMGLDNAPTLPLDVQIAAEEEESSFDYYEEYVELPIKTELDVVEDFEETKETEFYDKEATCESLGGIKVEMLDEGHEDRLEMILQMASVQAAAEYSEEASDYHFLTTSKRRQKRSRKSCKLKCAKCSAMFKYQSTYDYHVKSQCGSKMIAKCNKLIKKKKNQSFTCNECNKEMSSRTSLMVHMRIHNGERPFVCDVCQRSFTQKAHLKDHMNIHLSGKPVRPEVLTCSECGQLFEDKKSLVLHSKQHFGDKIFNCNVCQKRFRTISNLRNHKIIHSEDKQFSCTVCGREFLRKRGLVEHMRMHTQDKMFTCEICLKTFTNKTRRDTHFKRHTGELKAICSVCGRKFACAYDLRIHQRKHTGERPFSCNICGRMFNRKVIMETHMTIHTGRKDFVCTQCGEAFNRKSKLDIHLTTHTGETFCCEICHKVFKCKAYLVPHLRTHARESRKHAKKGIHCILCRKEFTTQKRLQNHFKQKHPAVFKACPPSPPTLVRVESSELAQLSIQNNSCERFEKNSDGHFTTYDD